MEFFENAHVSKKNLSKKEENMKKQLKQMLQGYKQNDNDLIKNTGKDDIAQVHILLDDSSSVSGVSDLDLTVSEDDEEVNAAVSETCDANLSNSSDDNLSNSGTQSNKNNKGMFVQELAACKNDDCLEPILECDEDFEKSDSENTDVDFDSFSQMSLLEFVDSSDQSISSVIISEEFDADGSLASKIMENLEKNKKQSMTKRHKVMDIKNKTKKTELLSKKLKKSLNKNAEVILENNTETNAFGKYVDSSAEDSLSKNESSTFISIKATEMLDQSLNEVLGDYKYPTIRNIPCDKQNSLSFTNNSEIFSIDNESQDEDVDSLAPEIGDDPIAEELEMDLDEDSENMSLIENTDVAWIPLPEPRDEDECDNEQTLGINPVRVYYTGDACIFVLKNPTELYINGKVKIKPLAGTVEVFGHTLKKEVELYSANNNFAQCLKTITADNEYFGLFGKLTSSGLSVEEAEDIVTSLGVYGCVLKMSPLVNPRIEFVEDYFPVNLFSKLKVENNAHRLSEPSHKLGCNIYLKGPMRCFQENPEWEEAVNCGLKLHSKGIVCGGKGLGKSTFVRYYINRVLDNGPVLVVDLDPGQAEFTVAGCISATLVEEPLLGPNYTHLKKPEISYNIGIINTMDNIYLYTSAVTELIEYCRSKYPYMPWIVNTMGMTNNIGLKFMLFIILRLQPTFLIQIDSRILKKQFDCYLKPDEIRTLYENHRTERLFYGIVLPEDLDYNFILTGHSGASYKHNTSLAPKDERYLNFLAYFGELMYTHSNFLGIVPYRVNLSNLNIMTNIKVDKDSILKVINGKIVALCQLNTTDKGKVFTLGDNALVCHGHGLIRGVEFENNVVYLVTPEPAERLSAVNTLVYSDWVPELQGIEQHLPSGTVIPYRCQTQHSKQMRAPRRRYNPLKLIKISRSA